MVRPARVKDVPRIYKLINSYAQKGVMLPKSLNRLYEELFTFSVVQERDSLVGCGALHVIWEDLGEIRSLAVKNSHQRKGVGSEVMNYLLNRAHEMDLKKVFVLTLKPDFFRKFGFRKIPKEKLPHKVWRDCLNCVKFPYNCDEIAMTKDLTKGK
jgi:amino-acid N-acetyltransferase